MTAPDTTTRRVLDRIFAPCAVAVVGVPRGAGTGRLFLEGLLDPGFDGPVYLEAATVGSITDVEARRRDGGPGAPWSYPSATQRSSGCAARAA